ncbi:uncharacterized protein LOC141910195 isoform X2 [Tubulanus polymorphus]|uniref:uncharacterized protein LOC141910195 isoform X2 n=1 Tax=Tubulanus polymorphus TaxID=672921 RepID=UPI003DA51CF0
MLSAKMAGHNGAPPISLSDKLRLAASKGHLEHVIELLELRASYEVDREGRSALHYAAVNGFAEVCKLLLEAGCDPNIQDNLGYTALHQAAAQGHREVIHELLSRHCDLNRQDRVNGNCAMHEAAWNGYSNTLEILTEAGANIFLTNKSGFTALHLSSQNGHNQSTRVLLQTNMNPDMKNNYGDTPLHTAARYGHAGVSRILISARCRINEQNKNGDTALHIAAALKRRKITKIICEAGVDKNICNKQNESAIDVARRKGHLEVIRIIQTQSSMPKPLRQRRGLTKCESSDFSNSEKEDRAPGEKRSLWSFGRKKKKKKEKEKVHVPTNPATRPVGILKNSPRQESLVHAPHCEMSPCHIHQPQYQQNLQAIDSFHPLGPMPEAQLGFFNQYVPRPGVQYYKDLAGNIKQGPVGFAPVCQCMPSLQRLEERVETENHNLYDHIDSSQQRINKRIDGVDDLVQKHDVQLNQIHHEASPVACTARVDTRVKAERVNTRRFVDESRFNARNQMQEWIDTRMDYLERRIRPHHGDCDWSCRRQHSTANQHVTDIQPGRLFRSRSDETLSASEANCKQQTQMEMARQVAWRELKNMRKQQQQRNTNKPPPPRTVETCETRKAPPRQNPNGQSIAFKPARYDQTDINSNMISENTSLTPQPRKVHSQDDLSPGRKTIERNASISAVSSPNVNNISNLSDPATTTGGAVPKRPIGHIYENRNVNQAPSGLSVNRSNYDICAMRSPSRSPVRSQSMYYAEADRAPSRTHFATHNSRSNEASPSADLNHISNSRSNSSRNINQEEPVTAKKVAPPSEYYHIAASRSADYRSRAVKPTNIPPSGTAPLTDQASAVQRPVPIYAFPNGSNKADSGSNHDSGYSYRLSGRPGSSRPDDGSPVTQSSTCSTGFNITSTSLSTGSSRQSPANSPQSVPLDSDEQRTKAFYERVNSQVYNWYNRRASEPLIDEGRNRLRSPVRFDNVNDDQRSTSAERFFANKTYEDVNGLSGDQRSRASNYQSQRPNPDQRRLQSQPGHPQLLQQQQRPEMNGSAPYHQRVPDHASNSDANPKTLVDKIQTGRVVYRYDARTTYNNNYANATRILHPNAHLNRHESTTNRVEDNVYNHNVFDLRSTKVERELRSVKATDV